VQAVLASLDVAVIPSLSESLSNVVLESMAAGKAVVASRVGGNPEVLQDGVTGRLFASEDHEECARAIADLLSDPGRRTEMGLHARAYAEQNFSLQRVRQRYATEYTELLETKRRERLRGVLRAGAKGDRARIRMALVAPSTRTLGGQAVQADLLLRHWREDEEVEAAFVPVDPTFPVGLRWIERIPFLRTLVRIPFYLNAVWRALDRADVAHLFSASYWSFLLAPGPALLLARWRGKATVLNYRSGEARDHLENWRTAVPILRRADRLVVPSGYLRDVFAEFGLPAEVVPNVVDLGQFAYRERRPLQARLVCTRGFEPYYDVDLVVRAFAEVKGKAREAQLCLVGGGRLESKVREVARELRLGSEVEFTGPVPRDRIGEHYARNDIFINASWLDNMPVSLLEAFASGTPVVTTAPEGIRYIVEHERTGLLCEPKDWRALAENALRLLREPDFARTLARNAYEESKGYRWEAVRERWLGVYRSVCQQMNFLPGRTPLHSTQSLGLLHEVDSAESPRF
jgi:glycosyltransferase involved in cell wall biosynthesis